MAVFKKFTSKILKEDFAKGNVLPHEEVEESDMFLKDKLAVVFALSVGYEGEIRTEPVKLKDGKEVLSITKATAYRIAEWYDSL